MFFKKKPHVKYVREIVRRIPKKVENVKEVVLDEKVITVPSVTEKETVAVDTEVKTVRKKKNKRTKNKQNNG